MFIESEVYILFFFMVIIFIFSCESTIIIIVFNCTLVMLAEQSFTCFICANFLAIQTLQCYYPLIKPPLANSYINLLNGSYETCQRAGKC